MDKQPVLSHPIVHLVYRRAQRNIQDAHKSLLSIVKQMRVVSGETLKPRRKTGSPQEGAQTDPYGPRTETRRTSDPPLRGPQQYTYPHHTTTAHDLRAVYAVGHLQSRPRRVWALAPQAVREARQGRMATKLGAGLSP